LQQELAEYGLIVDKKTNCGHNAFFNFIILCSGLSSPNIYPPDTKTFAPEV